MEGGEIVYKGVAELSTGLSVDESAVSAPFAACPGECGCQQRCAGRKNTVGGCSAAGLAQPNNAEEDLRRLVCFFEANAFVVDGRLQETSVPSLLQSLHSDGVRFVLLVPQSHLLAANHWARCYRRAICKRIPADVLLLLADGSAEAGVCRDVLKAQDAPVSLLLPRVDIRITYLPVVPECRLRWAADKVEVLVARGEGDVAVFAGAAADTLAQLLPASAGDRRRSPRIVLLHNATDGSIARARFNIAFVVDCGTGGVLGGGRFSSITAEEATARALGGGPVYRMYTKAECCAFPRQRSLGDCLALLYWRAASPAICDAALLPLLRLQLVEHMVINARGQAVHEVCGVTGLDMEIAAVLVNSQAAGCLNTAAARLSEVLRSAHLRSARVLSAVRRAVEEHMAPCKRTRGPWLHCLLHTLYYHVARRVSGRYRVFSSAATVRLDTADNPQFILVLRSRAGVADAWVPVGYSQLKRACAEFYVFSAETAPEVCATSGSKPAVRHVSGEWKKATDLGSDIRLDAMFEERE